MRELSLFTGAGGGVLGSKILGWEAMGYVEIDEYCQKILAQRIKDGLLDPAPIFGDIREFVSQGYAQSYSGLVDIITGGFPCQPFSVAGRGLGEADTRNMWPSTISVIRTVRPRFALLENVPGLLADEYIGRIFGDLAELGYSFKWDVFSADEVGAPHLRERLFIFAYSASERLEVFSKRHGVFEKNGEGRKTPNPFGSYWTDQRIDRLPDSELIRRGDGVAKRVDRLKAIGNGQVPLCMAYAFSILSQGIVE